MENENRVIVITGASGAGKTSVARYLRAKYSVPRVITHTTREPREGEIDGVDYYFETEDSWGKNHFIEQVNYSGYKYGSSYEGLERAWAKSKRSNHPGVISLVVDTIGAITYRETLKDQAIIWFVTVSDVAGLRNRLIARGDNPKRVVERTSSNDFERDMHLPEKLKNRATVIINDNWQLTQEGADKFINKLFYM
ncbi:GTPase [Oenococcus oeni]|uniref:GTPase n=1 Tax=Oenococcus oeni TaxID=1247 RepID=UPI0004D5A16A|nr:GTPase [Oenococcus oeni]AWW99155.1 guanylate kinase [Oenococcus oeni]KEK02608.1 guanylate kinase [Oenococcus oeni]KER94495.1 guanylate kinase [Oenococcus oeni]KER96015.1 guanylate kinase [Oenococcus oeni]OIL50218.1 guanylate kinase [Oenococcus oeni]